MKEQRNTCFAEGELAAAEIHCCHSFHAKGFDRNNVHVVTMQAEMEKWSRDVGCDCGPIYHPWTWAFQCCQHLSSKRNPTLPHLHPLQCRQFHFHTIIEE